MGSCVSRHSDFVVIVHTGDRADSGTDASIHIKLFGAAGEQSESILLDRPFFNDFERGARNKFFVSKNNYGTLDPFSKIDSIELSRDSFGLKDDWFVDKIIVECPAQNVSYMFPIFRWIKPGVRHNVVHLDTSLPAVDRNQDQRKQELKEKREQYRLGEHYPGVLQAAAMPSDEKFSFDYNFDIHWRALKSAVVSRMCIDVLTNKKWASLESIKKVYEHSGFPVPKSTHCWRDDLHFGRQRVARLNLSVIKLVTEIPEKFPVTDELLQGLLEDFTLAEAIQKKRLFICDLDVLEGVHTGPNLVLCVPICLLFLAKDNQLRPVAIQLFQTPGDQNPIFTPLDDDNLWTLVKIWYNNADAAYHQAGAHLGMTHLVMEGVCVITHRNLSPSHPIFKLLAPHFLYLIAVNHMALRSLVSPGGWVDSTMTYGAEGMMQTVIKVMSRWRLDVQGTLPEDLKSRGVDDVNVLPYYPYRDDALLIYDAILNYVSGYVDLYYTENKMLKEDSELQSWGKDLVKEANGAEGGLGLRGVPGNGEFSSSSQLTQVLSSVIFICSVGHAASNFPQYDEYAFPPNYAGMLHGKPPSDKREVKEEDILSVLPDRSTTMDIMVVTDVLSQKGTNSLGDFEVHYVYDPKAVEIANEFRRQLSRVKEEIKGRNRVRSHVYDILDPQFVPNAISI